MGVIFLFSLLNPNYGFGLQNNSQDAESFFKRKNLQGPILNSYENGSYIIFYLFPTEKVFVDGRPEAYSVEFQRDAALKVFEDENTFKHLDNMYGFNTIILPTSALDERYKNFIFRRLAGNQWTGVLLDQHSVILVRTDSQNNAFQFNNKVSALEDKLNITKRSERKNVPNFWLYLINFFS